MTAPPTDWRRTVNSMSEPQPAGALLPMRLAPAQRALSLARIALGFVFLWGFLDKCFGLGLSTPSDQAWRFGTGPGDPTYGYLTSIDGPFAWLFNPMAGSTLVTWLYMLGMAGVGVGLMTGLAFRFSAICGALMLFMFYLSGLPLSLNPFVDDHVIEILMLVGLILLRNGRFWGASAWWEERVGARAPFLR
jgi:thiosulfate dehydrogenase [quinone] large subunit